MKNLILLGFLSFFAGSNQTQASCLLELPTEAQWAFSSDGLYQSALYPGIFVTLSPNATGGCVLSVSSHRSHTPTEIISFEVDALDQITTEFERTSRRTRSIGCPSTTTDYVTTLKSENRFVFRLIAASELYMTEGCEVGSGEFGVLERAAVVKNAELSSYRVGYYLEVFQ